MRGVLGKKISKFVDDETAYLKKHKTRALTLLEAEGKMDVHQLKADGTRRKKGTFPDEIIADFK